MITSIIIDDDSNLRLGLKGLLQLYAPELKIVGEADSVLSGIEIIEKHNPQVVFLDIQLNQGTGFDIIEQLVAKHGAINTHIVFITAHEQYAIRAFRFSALDFLLKPVDPIELQKVIKKIKDVLHKQESYAHIDLLLENISKKTDNFRRIALSNSDGVHLFDTNEIIRCESQDNYTKFYIKDNKPILISKTLKEYEELLSNQGFIRIHQSHLINLNFLKSYIKKDGGYIIMADNSKLPISKRKKEQLQEIFKNI